MFVQMLLTRQRSEVSERIRRRVIAHFDLEDTPETGPGEACFTDDHFMLIPTRPCTGVESPDPKCAGREGEWYWGYAWDEVLPGFPVDWAEA